MNLFNKTTTVVENNKIKPHKIGHLLYEIMKKFLTFKCYFMDKFIFFMHRHALDKAVDNNLVYLI